MRNVGRFAILLVLFALVAALTAGGAAAQSKKAPPKVAFTGGFVYHSETIAAGATAQFNVTCPAGYAATGGAVASGSPKLLSLLSVPAKGGKAWSFGFRNTDTKAITVTVVVTCTKPPPVIFTAAMIKKLKLKKAAPVTVGPLQSVNTKATCPEGTTPVGDTEQSNPAAKTTGQLGGTQLTSIAPSGRGIEVGIRNPTAQAEIVQVGAICLPKQLKGRRGHVSSSARRASFPTQVHPGGGVVSGSCSGLALFAGFILPADGAASFVGTGFRSGTLGVSWAFANSSSTTASAQVSLICVPGRVKFVEGLSGTAVTGTIDTIVGPITITG